MTTQFKIFPCRAKGTALVRSGRAARQPACAFRRKARAASRKTPQIAPSQPRPPGAGPLSARAGRKNANTAISSVSGRTERHHFPHTAAVCRPRALYTPASRSPSHAPRRQHKAPQIASHRSRPAGAGPLFQSGKEKCKHRQFPCLKKSGRTERRHFPHTASVCRSPRTLRASAPHSYALHTCDAAHFTRQRPARLTHPRPASRELRPQARRT